MRDRCTKAHEYVFLLSKSERYFFDQGAMHEDAVKGAAGSSFNRGKTAEHQLGRSSERDRVDLAFSTHCARLFTYQHKER